MDLDEILTGVTGFIIAMVIVGVAIGLVIYGYYVYAQHQTLENYLWPVADLVPAKGNGYWLAVINTGHEPFYVKYIIYKNGEIQRTNSGVLHHNQYWLKHLDQLPAEVMVCSAVDPKVCTTAPVHYWYIPQGTIYVFLSGTGSNTGSNNGSGNNNGNNTNQPPPPGSIEVIVNDTYGAYWQITWSDTQGAISGSQSGSSNAQWTINNVPSGDTVNLQASVQSPSGLSCTIEPTRTPAKAGQLITFTVYCTAPQNAVLVVVNDTYGAGWKIQWSLSASGSKSGNSSTTFLIQTTGMVYLQAWVTSTNGWQKCTISPGSTTANPGQTVIFNVNCTGPPGGTVIVNVIDDYGAGWQIQYYDQLDLIGQHTVTGDSNYTWTIQVPSGDGLVFYSSITSVPSGYNACGIYPIQAFAGPLYNGENQTVTFTVICSTLPPIKVTVNDNYGAGWLVTWSGVVSGNFSWTYSDSWIVVVPTNSAEVFNAKIISTPSGYSSCSISPSKAIAYPGQSITFNVNCQQQSSNGGGGTIWVQVYDDPGAGWSITASGGANGTYTGSSSTAFSVSASNTTYFTASITSIPNGYSSCSINPPSQSANPGQTISFTVSCSNSTNSSPTTGSISVSVTNDTLGAGWEVTWSDTQGVVSGSQGGSSDYSWTISNVPSGDTVYFSASITSNPTGYKCTISPSSTSASPGGSVTFTVSCTSTQSTQPPKPQPVYGCYLDVTATSNPSGINVGYNAPSFITNGSSATVSFNAPTAAKETSGNGEDTWYGFQNWEITANPASDMSPSSPYTTNNPTPSVTVNCPSGLSQNITIYITGVANYQQDYVELNGPPNPQYVSINSTITLSYTVSWQLIPDSAIKEVWSVTGSGSNGTTLTVTVKVYYGNNQPKTVSWPIKIYVTGTCPPKPVGRNWYYGTPSWEAWFTETQSTSETTYVTGETNSATVSVTVYGYCWYP